MDRGDIVSDAQGNLFVVGRLNPDGTALLLGKRMLDRTVSVNEPDYQVKGNPYRDWPFVVLPNRAGLLGELRSVSRPSVSAGEVESTPLKEAEDWLLGEPNRNGGALYLNPNLALKPLERVVLTYDRGIISAPIPRTFLEVARKAVSARFRRISGYEPPTVFEHLVKENGDE